MRFIMPPLLGTAFVCALLTLPFASSPAESAPPEHAANQGAIKPGELNLRLSMRKLWEDHVAWTRLVIVATANNTPDLDATTQRLLRNQTDIGNAIKPYYGDAAGTQLSALLRTHILGAAEILAAAKQTTPKTRDCEDRLVRQRRRDRDVPEYSQSDELAARRDEGHDEGASRYHADRGRRLPPGPSHGERRRL